LKLSNNLRNPGLMNQSKISVRYAKALFLSAKEKNLLENIRNDMNFVHRTIHDFPEISAFFSNPVISIEQKKQTIEGLFSNRIHELSKSFLCFVTTKKREHYLSDITRNFNDLCRRDLGIKTVVLTTAIPADPEISKEVNDTVKNVFKTDIELTELTNEKILGGFILQVEDLLYDSSVISKLKAIRRNLINYSFEKKF